MAKDRGGVRVVELREITRGDWGGLGKQKGTTMVWGDKPQLEEKDYLFARQRGKRCGGGLRVGVLS